MQMISEVMTRNVQFVTPQETLQRTAQMMDELNVGALPVCEGDRLVGMVTDRDITIRATAAGKSPQQAHVDEVMSTDVRWVFEDQTLDDVMIEMADSQIRRVPVVTHDDAHKLVGIVSLADVATQTPANAQKEDVGQMVEMISSPDGSGSSSALKQSGATDVAGRTGAGTAGDAATGTGSAGTAGVGMSKAGETGTGSVGASGDTGSTPSGDYTDAASRARGAEGPDVTGNPNDVGQAGDYSR